MFRTKSTRVCPSIVLLSTISACLIAPTWLSAQDQAPQKNSTRKIRVNPNAQAKRIGSAIKWQPDFETAVAKSKETGKPIFWYVPTLRGTFMDRKNEIDRYMLAGPFSWPDIVSVINEHYIPVRHAPTTEQQKAFHLVPYEFVEPGFLIIGKDDSAESKLPGLDMKINVSIGVDRITTMHPEWFRHLLTTRVLQPIRPEKKPEALLKAWKLFRSRDFHATVQHLAMSKNTIQSYSDSNRCECALLLGMAQFRSGKHELAKLTWTKASETFADEPLAWKAAAEAQMIGPFARGFEVFNPLPPLALNAGETSAGSQAPKGTYTVPQLWRNGMQFLLGMQNEKGGFTDCDYDFGGTDSLPNVHVAVTSLAGMAMLKACERKDLTDELRTKLTAAIDSAISYVTDESNINKFDRDEILWAYAYRLRFLSRCLQQNVVQLKTNPHSLKEAIAQAAKALENVQSRQGSWYHEYNNSFVTATALVALHEAAKAGAELDQSKIQKGVASLLSDRFANGAYPYSSSRRAAGKPSPGTARDVAAAAGRMPICELGLWHWDKSSDKALVSAIRRSLDLQENLDIALKYDDHTSRLAYGGFFFWYDMRGRSEAISRVRDAAMQAEFKAKHKAMIMALPELDGCFVDSHELGRVYGTAMALLSLANCQ